MTGATALIPDVQDMDCVANVSHITTGWGSFLHVFSPKRGKPPGTDLMKCLRRIGKTSRLEYVRIRIPD